MKGFNHFECTGGVSMNRVQATQMGWMAHRRVLNNLLDVVPADKVTFAPWEGAMSFGALAVHTADDFFYRFVKTGELSRTPVPEWTTLEDVKRIVQQRTDSIQSIFAEMTEEDLDKILEISNMGMKGPGSWFLMAAKDHEVHHKGQLFVYARLMGVTEMPFFISRG
jgi:uncharacterized damage-inducible protein DinB